MKTKPCTVCKTELPEFMFHKRSASSDGYRSECKDCGKQNTKNYRTKNSKRVNELNKLAYEKNAEDRIKYAAKRRLNSNYDNEYRKKRLKGDPAFRAIHNARNRARKFAKHGSSFSKSLGCSYLIFVKHLESLFKPGMTWKNYGEWEIDHKFPLSIAYKNGPEAFANACHYSNLQPLWAQENLKKGNKVA